MSGNPFRRVQQPHETSEIRVDTVSIPGNASTNRRSSKVKRVRIATPPPLSPDSIKSPGAIAEEQLAYRTANERHAFHSPPLDSPAIEAYPGADVPSISPGHRVVGEQLYPGQQVLNNTRANRGANITPENSGKDFVNPFERTLATMENTLGRPIDQALRETPLSNATLNVGHVPPLRQVMDVDSFTRMLMAGRAVSSSSVPSATMTTPSVPSIGGSNSTDTSSISRHSLNEPSIENYTESPRTSYEISRSDDEVLPNASSDKLETKRTKAPPPPKPRHGKPVGPRTPQIVSFSDFAPSETSANRPRAGSKTLPPIPSQKISSDRDKALPQPPASPDRQTQQPAPDKSNKVPRSQPEFPSQPLAPLPIYRPPLELPSPQRSSMSQVFQTSRSRADSNLSSSSEQGSAASRLFEESSSSKARPPPPPPSRRAGSKSLASSQQNSAITSPFPPLPSQSDDPTSAPELLTSRRPSSAMPGSSRSSSISMSGRATMPPPPPPRRRGSSRGSDDLGRPPGLSQVPGDSRRPSRVELVGVAEGELGEDDNMVPMTMAKPSDMLADLDSLQAEVDALRERYRRTS